MKKIFIVISVLVFFGFFGRAANAGLISFDNSGDLTNYFNGDGSPGDSYLAGSGLSSSGGIKVPYGFLGDVWTLKTGENLSSGGSYAVSAYFLNSYNAGYGGLGFATANSNIGNGNWGTPASTSLGMAFHGGGGGFSNNGSISSLIWGGGDLALNQWFKITYELNFFGGNTFNASILIENSDSNGVVSGIRAQKTLNGQINANLAASSILYPYFMNKNIRVNVIDNFESNAVTFLPVPEPSTLILLGAGILGVLIVRKK